MIRIDAFQFTKRSKTELLWEAIFKLNVSKQGATQARLFKPKHRQFSLPTLTTTYIEEAYDQIELLGFPLGSYFDLIDHVCQENVKASALNKYVNHLVMFDPSLFIINDSLIIKKIKKINPDERINKMLVSLKLKILFAEKVLF